MLKYISETKMGKADGLSRRADWKVGVEKNNENQVVVKESWLHRLEEVVVEGPEVDILEKIKNMRSKDEDIVRIIEEMKRTKVKELWGDEWRIEEDLVLKEGKIYVPKDVKNERSGLKLFLFSLLIFILFLIYFPLLYF